MIIVRQKRESGCSSLDQAFNEILALPPYQLSRKVKETLEDYSNTEEQLDLAETLHYEGPLSETGRHQLTSTGFSKNMDTNDHESIDGSMVKAVEQRMELCRSMV